MSTDELVIRAAWPSDLTAVARIYAHYVTHTFATFEQTPPSLDAWRDRFWQIAEKGFPFLVATIDGSVTGYAYCSPWRSRQAYRHTAENTVYVAPDAIGRGVGRALLADLLPRCAAVGIQQVIAVISMSGEAEPHSSTSVLLHKRFGFTTVGRLQDVGHKHDRWLDTLLMQRTLTADRPRPGSVR